MNYSDVKFDCRHFRTTIPCKPNKLYDVTCIDCNHYQKIEKKILIIKLGALGDVIRTTPLLTKFRKLYPNCHITWVTYSPDILPKNMIDEIYKLNEVSIYNVSNSTYDIAINLDKELEACNLLKNCNSTEKYGYITNGIHIAPATEAAKHKLMTGFFDNLSKINTKSYLEEIFEICHFNFEKEEYHINLNETLSEKWKNEFSLLATNKKIIGLNTGCGPRWNTRLWEEKNWIELAINLREAGFYPVFLGGELEHQKNVSMASCANVHYPGHYSLEEFIAMTNAMDLVVTQVSMMMHIATALKTKMILMNNIFNFHEFELYGRGEIVSPDKECHCYYGNSCSKYEMSCMEHLPVDKVFNSIQKHL